MKNLFQNQNIKSRVMFVILFLGLFVTSCNEYLDVNPTTAVSDETLFQSTTTADLLLNKVYSSLPSEYNVTDVNENWTDNSLNGVQGNYSYIVYAHSAYNPDNVSHFWGYYGPIRTANLFIQKVRNSNFDDEEWVKKRIAEARFLRAYYYMLMSTAHGGVPIITEVLNYSEQGEEIFRPRNTAEETFQFIIDECEAIVNDLPPRATDGRANAGAALALKGYVELFYASPLHNLSNDLSRWQSAASTYKRIIDSKTFDLFSDYETMFYEDNNGNIETIFAKQHLGGTGLGSSHEGIHGVRFSGGTTTSWAEMDPTQELVDEYCMSNGLPIDDPESGYDPQNPYVNREKRFYQSIVYDGSVFNNTEIIIRRGLGSPNEFDINSVGERTNTGYYPRKAINPKYAINSWNQLSSADFIIFRYAEVLLSYAEAQNEAVGPDQSVYEAVNKVRERSDLPPLKAGLSQNEMREAIHRERRVELCFEMKRWRDLLRLKIAEDKLNGYLHAMDITQKNGKWVYNVVPAPEGERVFYPEKNYFLPIPQAAIDRNPKLEQNPKY